MSFHHKFWKPFNKPFDFALKPFVGTINFLTRPRFIASQQPSQNFSRAEIKAISDQYQLESDITIEELTQKRLLEIEYLLTKNLKLKPRIAVEFEFTFRDEKGKPIRLLSSERKALDEILKEELPSFHASDKPVSPSADAEYKFDTKGEIPLMQLLNDISNFRKNFSRYQDEVFRKTGIIRPKLIIDDKPYQPEKGHLGVMHDNTTSMHVNVSLENEAGENIFYADREILEKAVSSLLDLQLPAFGLSPDKLGIDRIHKGSSSVDMISAGENSATGSYARFGKVVSAGTLSLASLISLIIADAGVALKSPVCFYALAGSALGALLLDKKISNASSSISFRTISKNKLMSMLQRYQKRPAKTASATRIENRLGRANQDPALLILNTLFPIYKSLKTDDASITVNITRENAIPATQEELLQHALSAEAELRELYGDELFERLLAQAVNDLLS